MTQKKIKVAIQGGPASFHEVAAQQYFPEYDVESMPCQSFRELCEVLHKSKADQAVMAVENTLAGSILPNYNLLHQYNLFVTGELWLPIEQNLMALPGQQLQDLRKVPEGEIISEAEFNDSLSFLQPWGFTIYRTYYGPGSDRQWDELIQIVTNGTKDAVQSERPQELPMTLP